MHTSFKQILERWGGAVVVEAQRIVRARGCPVETLPDLVVAGQAALWEASTRYDPGRAAFWTFAQRRVRGAMFDELRGRDHLGQQGRRYLREHGSARCPWALVAPVPIEDAHHVRERDDVESAVADREVVRISLERVGCELGDKYAAVVRMYYLEGMRQREIAGVLGVSEGRVSQIRRIALRYLAPRSKQRE